MVGTHYIPSGLRVKFGQNISDFSQGAEGLTCNFRATFYATVFLLKAAKVDMAHGCLVLMGKLSGCTRLFIQHLNIISLRRSMGENLN